MTYPTDRHDGPDTEHSRTLRLRHWAIACLLVSGIIATGIGLVRLGAPTGSASLGWCAYTPLGGSTYFPSGLLLTPRNQFGLALLIVAVASIAFGAGLAVGLRRSRTTVGRADDRA